MKKGFTLVELLAVRVSLAVILAVVFPAVNSILGQSKETVHNAQIKRILDATYDYSLKNMSILPDKDKKVYITLNELKKDGFIDNDIKDAITKESFSNDLVISVTNVGSNYKNQNTDSIKNGDYLYRVESEFMKTDDFKNNKPIIKFEGYDNSDVVIILNNGATYNEVKYSAETISGTDITNKVIKTINYNTKLVDKIDTSKEGIYKIIYSVVDENGYSNMATISLIINDKEAPILTIPDNETISTSIKSYNLMSNVSCEDNSGICDISVSGNINYGVEGKYIIEYKATDPSGNTTVLKRVITIK